MVSKRKDEQEAQLLADFTRIVVGETTTVLEVATIRWESPCTPNLDWHVYMSWKSAPIPEHTAQIIADLLADQRYFRTCDRCNKLNCAGHMHDQNICQGCAERHLGGVY